MTQSLSIRNMRAALTRCASGLVAVGAFSAVINLLVLGGPIYMMLVYDRALGSGSVPTLVGLSVLLAGMFLAMGLLNIIRSRLLIRLANRLSNTLEPLAFRYELTQRPAKAGQAPAAPVQDLATLRDFLSGSVPATLFDAPWTPVFILLAFVLHPVLGMIALSGATVLIVLGILNDVATRRKSNEAHGLHATGAHILAGARRNQEVVTAMRMLPGLYNRWSSVNARAQVLSSRTADTAGTYGAVSRTFRMALQSTVLGAGAYLAIQGVLSPGAIIASSVIVARGLAPAEQAIGGWRQFIAARGAYGRLDGLLRASVEQPEPIDLPEPKGKLDVRRLIVMAPGGTHALLRGASFSIEPGETLAIIGPSGSGKSTLIRALTGAWSAKSGEIRLDGATLDQWPDHQMQKAIGYLPQEVELFEGTVSENIARLSPEIDDKAVVEAARLSGAHEMILRLPNGYATQLGAGGAALSGGERQRIGLARAVYGNPALVVLDEPNASLDAVGDAALSHAIDQLKLAGQSVVLVTHRPNAIENADKVLVLQNGLMKNFGTRSEVMGESANRPAMGSVVSMENRKQQ